MANELARYDPTSALVEQAMHNIEGVDDLAELNRIQDLAAGLRETARQARQPKIIWNYFMATAIWARWKIGKMLPEIISHGGDRKSESRLQDETLISLGMDKVESHRWQLLARIGKDELRAHVALYDGKANSASTLTFNGCYKLLPKPAAPEGTFDVIIIDPPWEMKKIALSDRPNQEDMDYAASMKEKEIIDWGHANLKPALDCHLFLWTTQRYLPASFHIVHEWKARYVCTFVWHKPGGFQPFGLPQYNCEFALYGRIGTPVFTTTKGLKTCFTAPRGAHSEKPNAFYDMIRDTTKGPRVDMFGRRPRDGYQIVGDEV